MLHVGTIILALSMLAVPYGSGGLVSQPAEPQADEENAVSIEG